MDFVAPALTALFGTLFLTATLRRFAGLVRLIDTPTERKDHIGEIPLVGGIAMFIGIAVGLALVTGLDSATWNLILACLLLVVVGAIDDRNGLPSIVRLVAQTCAALIIVVGGNQVIADIGNPFGTGILVLGPAAVAVSVVITITVINAFNFSDGVDGLASCMALIALAAGAVAGGWTAPSSIVAIVVAAAIIGFLIFNFPTKKHNRRRTFMGDAGSTMLGLIVVWLTIEVCQGETRHISPVVGLWFVLVPVADFFSCFVQRISRSTSPLLPGREHFHHVLLRAGLSARQVVGTLCGGAIVYATLGLLGSAAGVPDWVMFALWMALLVSQHWIVAGLAKWLPNLTKQLTATETPADPITVQKPNLESEDKLVSGK